MGKLAIRILTFDQLSLHELYEILKLRSAIFVVEQDCVYQDLDDQDQEAVHLLAYAQGRFAAYTRIIPPDDKNTIHIGRVLVSKAFRGHQFGREIMEQSIHFCEKSFTANAIELAAQAYLREFYTSLHFKVISEEYLLDGIPHLDMRWEP